MDLGFVRGAQGRSGKVSSEEKGHLFEGVIAVMLKMTKEYHVYDSHLE